jgi:hypothetical protein
VLWRILIAQLYLYDSIRRIYEVKKKNKNLQDSAKVPEYIKPIPEKKRKEELDWRKNCDEANDLEVFVEPFDAVEHYLQQSMELRDLI